MKKKNATGPYIVVCGKCNVPLKVHPVKQCPYLYTPTVHKGRICGYRMTRKSP